MHLFKTTFQKVKINSYPQNNYSVYVLALCSAALSERAESIGARS